MDVRQKTRVNQSGSSATRPPQQHSVVPSSAVNSSLTAQFLKALIEGKDFNDHDLFLKLKLAYGEQQAHGVYIKEYRIDDLDTEYKQIQYQREAAVYHRNMSNKFFVPIWAAAMEQDEAYIMYPLLTPLTEILPKLKIDIPDSKKEKRLMETLRRCFAPIALGLDALHTPVLNSRTMYYHRDLSITKIFMCESNHEKTVLYGDAMLKLSKFTRGSQEEMLDVSHSIGTYSFPRKYFHHPEPWRSIDDNMYHRKHDWFSFGVYIADVLVNVLPVSDELRDKLIPERGILHLPMFNGVSDYVDFVSQIGECVGDVAWNERASKLSIEQYLEIAKTCLSMTTEGGEEIRDVEQVMHYEVSQALKDKFPPPAGKSFEPYNFEYGLNRWTAELLWMYNDSRTEKSRKFLLSRPQGLVATKTNSKKRNDSVCQACLLHQSVKIPTRTYRRSKSRSDDENMDESNQIKCNEWCNTFYCVSCYTNGERLFCPRQHGTTSSVIGHYSSFALIMYGDEQNGVFKKDATSLANVLTHRLICGIPEENVVIAPLFDREKPARDPEEFLQDACYEVRRLIHKRKLVGSHYEDVDTCVNDAQYTLFIFYSGHGRKGGHWCVSQFIDAEGKDEAVLLEKNVVDNHLMSIRNCTNEENPSCDAFCIEVTYLMDHCFPAKKRPPVIDEIDGTSTTLITPWIATKSHYTLELNSEITRWFCDLLRCVGFHHLENKKQECYVCAKLRAHIAENCYNAFIDAYCLDIDKEHFKDPSQFDSKVPRVDVEPVDNELGKNIILSHYHKNGIFLKVFPYQEQSFLEPVDIEFSVDLTCDRIKEMIVDKLRHQEDTKKKFKNKELHICLLANLPNDYSRFSLVCDSNIRKVLDFSLLYYHVFTERCKVTLKAIDRDGHMEDSLDNVDVSSLDLLKLASECGKAQTPPRAACPLYSRCLLPNLLVHVVHHLRHVVYKGTAVDLTSSMYSRQASSNLTAQESKILQPTTSQDDSETERVRNSFVGLLYRRPRNGQRVREYTSAQWNELEEEVKQYIRAERVRVFDIEPLDTNVVCVTWDMSLLPSAEAGTDIQYSSIAEDDLELNADDELVHTAIMDSTPVRVSTPIRASTAAADIAPLTDSTPLTDCTPLTDTTPVGVSAHDEDEDEENLPVI